MTPYILTSVPGVKIVERGRKIDEEKINEGRLEGERFFRSCPPPPSSNFPCVQFNSLTTDRHALLSERLEWAD